MTSYAWPQQRTQSRSRYDFSDADEDYRMTPRSSRPSQYNIYDDRGRPVANRSLIARPTSEPRYMPQPTYTKLAPYQPSAYPLPPTTYTYTPPSTQRSPSRGRTPHSTSRGSSASRHRSRSRSRLDRVEEQARDALGKTFDSRGKGVGAGIVGALVGAAIGKRLGDRDDNHALAGAIIGGLGVNALENQIHRSRERRREVEEERKGEKGGWRRSISLARGRE